MDNRVHYKDCSRYNWHDPGDQCDGARCEILCPNCGALSPTHLWMCWSCHAALIDGGES